MRNLFFYLSIFMALLFFTETANGQQFFRTSSTDQFSPVNITTIPPTCYSGGDGVIAFDVIGGQEPYEYLWEDGTSENTNSDLSAGTYSVTVTDASGLSEEILLHLNDAEEIVFEVNIGINNRPSADVSGGTSPYSFLVNGEELEELPEQLSGGSNMICVIDSHGCISDEISLGILSIENSGVYHPSCYGEENGFIVLGNVTGGQAPFDVNWKNGSTANQLSNLAAGIYECTINSADDLSAVYKFEIEEPEPLEAAISFLNRIATIDAIGGREPYTFSWPDGDSEVNTFDVAELDPERYIVAITDALGCTFHLDFYIWNTGIEDEFSKFHFYPNPLSSGEAIQLEGLPEQAESIQLFDQMGRLVFVQELPQNATASGLSFDLPDLSQGIYYLSVSSAQHQASHKILIE